MFTGIIEEVGKVQSIKNGEKSFHLIINALVVLDKTIVGDSICTNGVCLTVTRINRNNFEADVMAETLRKSNLANLKSGDYVNLERALTLEKRLGGHLVSGHIDGTGEVIKKEKEDNAIWITIKTVPGILRYIIRKGSITVDGISLTVAYVDENIFKVSVIPHTNKNTILSKKQEGETVNLECDILGKYVEKLLGLQENSSPDAKSIDEEFLKNNGFL